MTKRTPGLHRRPGRLSAASTTLTRSAAVAATSTGLVAGMAVTAGAGSLPRDTGSTAGSGVEALARLALTVRQDPTLAVDRPAQAAAAPEAVSSPTSFGTHGFTAVAAPVAEPEPVVEQAAPAEEPQAAAQEQAAAAVTARAESSASRTVARTAPTPAPQPAPQPAPEPAPEPAPVAPAPAPAPAGGGILGIAASLTGIPYVYGGSSPAGFDCSGYTSYVFAQAGYSLPRSAAGQQAATTPVSNPQPGDLVFFGYPAYHVGIYAGGGMMYDAGRPGIPTQYRAVFGGVSGYGRVG